MMPLFRIIIFCVISLCWPAISPTRLSAQDLPLGYENYFKEDAGSTSFLTSLTFPAPGDWKVSKYGCTLIGPQENDSIRNLSFPQTQGIIPNLVFGEYIMEFEIKLLDSCHTDRSGFYFLSPVKDCGNYYAFGFTTDSIRFYYPKEKSGIPFSAASHHTDLYKWTKVKVVRNMLNRSVSFQLNGWPKEGIAFTDRRLVMGYVGFGAQDVNIAVRNIRIWAPTAFEDKLLHCE